MSRHALYLPDANVLINVLRQDAPAHQICRTWLLETTREGNEVGLCELVEVALLRICTHPRTRIAPVKEALGFWQEDLWTYPQTRRLVANPGQNRVFARFVTDLGLVGNDINDAWLAALAIEHRAALVSLDEGFSRFPGLLWHNPATSA